VAAGKLDLTIEQGATFRHTLFVKQGEGANAPAADLTSYTARMQIRTEVNSTTVLIALTTENGRITITPLTGRLDLLISATDTAALAFESGVHDLEIVSSGGEVTRLVQGKVKLSREVTR
jgi:hypothetical protein